MGKVITLGLQKGGVSKSTTTGILGYLMAEDGHKVLIVDMDSQGNVTEMLTMKSANETIGRSVYEATVLLEPEAYIMNLNDNLDLLPANNFLSLFGQWVWTSTFIRLSTDNKERFNEEQKREMIPPVVPKRPSFQFDRMLDKVRDKYDYILIDTPPSLSEQTTSALIASDYVICMFESSVFCYAAIPNFFETIETAQGVSDHGVKPVGILRTLNDRRRTDAREFNDLIASDEEIGHLCFDTVITRKASVGRLPLYGLGLLQENGELEDALGQFREFYAELKERIGG